MARQFVVLCEDKLIALIGSNKASAPEADPEPEVAAIVEGPYASAKIAEEQVFHWERDGLCKSRHFIVEAKRFRRLIL